MTSKGHLSDFEFGSIRFIDYTDEPVKEDPRKHLVTLLLALEPKGFDYNWGYAAVSRVFKTEEQQWIGDYTAVISVSLPESLRDPRGLVRSYARKLKKAFEDEQEQFRHESHEDEEEDRFPDYDAVCNCGERSSQHIGGDGPCTVCGCEYFGQPLEEWMEFTEVNLSDSNMGFHSYE